MFSQAQRYNFYRLLGISFFAGLILLFLALLPLFDNRVHLVFCDVGQGDGILIYQATAQIIIDGGPDKKILNCLSQRMPFWDRKIEMVVLTNPDKDHYGGLIDVAKRYDIGLFASSPVGKADASFAALVEQLSRHKVRTKNFAAGDEVKLGALDFKAVWPTKQYMADNTDWEEHPDVLGATTEERPNVYSLVFAFSYGAFDCLLTGDIAPPATDLMAEALNHQVEVLKVPHHGSKNGLTDGLLQAIKPQVAIISDGKNNRYGHPHKETLDELERWKVKTFRTDLTGEIEVITDGKTWQIKD